jgi:hypothetical protein
MKQPSRLVLCFLVLVAAAAAQKPSTSHKASPIAGAEKLIALKATGTKRYTDKELLAASGLQIGQNATDGDFREAAKRWAIPACSAMSLIPTPQLDPA